MQAMVLQKLSVWNTLTFDFDIYRYIHTRARACSHTYNFFYLMYVIINIYNRAFNIRVDSVLFTLKYIELLYK